MRQLGLRAAALAITATVVLSACSGAGSSPGGATTPTTAGDPTSATTTAPTPTPPFAAPTPTTPTVPRETLMQVITGTWLTDVDLTGLDKAKAVAPTEVLPRQPWFPTCGGLIPSNLEVSLAGLQRYGDSKGTWVRNHVAVFPSTQSAELALTEAKGMVEPCPGYRLGAEQVTDIDLITVPNTSLAWCEKLPKGFLCSAVLKSGPVLDRVEVFSKFRDRAIRDVTALMPVAQKRLTAAVALAKLS